MCVHKTRPYWKTYETLVIGIELVVPNFNQHIQLGNVTYETNIILQRLEKTQYQ